MSTILKKNKTLHITQINDIHGSNSHFQKLVTSREKKSVFMLSVFLFKFLVDATMLEVRNRYLSDDDSFSRKIDSISAVKIIIHT